MLICHALSGDAHVAGWRPGQLDDDGVPLPDAKPGWWDIMVGPGKTIDTDRYFVICSNVLGGCRGTTGPASIDPATGTPYGLRFPIVTIEDMVDAAGARSSTTSASTRLLSRHRRLDGRHAGARVAEALSRTASRA